MCMSYLSPKSDRIPLIQNSQEPKILISIFASLSFASEIDLGWDPSIQRVLVDGKMCYEIKVHEKQDEQIFQSVYRTFKVVSDVGAIGLRGRGTRVFLAHPLDENGEVDGDPVVLKDVWVDVTRPREGQIREALLEAADEQDREVLKTHTMTIQDSGDVFINGEPDNTHTMLRKLSIPNRATFCLQPAVHLPRNSYLGEGENSQRDYAFQRAPHSPHRTYPDKVHHRVVFREIGTPIDMLRNLKDVRAVMVDIVRGQSLRLSSFRSVNLAHQVLQVCHKYSRVHRDISAGNVYLFKGRGLLGDLEYMKVMGQEKENEVRTVSYSSLTVFETFTSRVQGTLDFMAVEVDNNKYLFRPDVFDPDLFEQDLLLPKAPRFHYNPLHDLESIWWVGVRTIFTCGVDGVDDPLALEKQERNASLLFPRALHVTTRRDAIQDYEDFLTKVADLCIPF